MGKVLIVDDSALSRRILRGMIEAEGHEVVEAVDGLAALESYYLSKPDLVFLDLIMEGLKGLDVLTKLRELDPEARVVIATADIQRSTESLAEEGGAVSFVTKPFSQPLVRDVLRREFGAGGEQAGDR